MFYLLDPIPMAAVVGVTLAILIIFLILVIGLLIAYKKEKMCFKSKFQLFIREIWLLKTLPSWCHYHLPNSGLKVNIKP